MVQLDFREAEKGTRLEFGRVLLYQNADDLRIGNRLITDRTETVATKPALLRASRER